MGYRPPPPYQTHHHQPETASKPSVHRAPSREAASTQCTSSSNEREDRVVRARVLLTHRDHFHTAVSFPALIRLVYMLSCLSDSVPVSRCSSRLFQLRKTPHTFPCTQLLSYILYVFCSFTHTDPTCFALVAQARLIFSNSPHSTHSYKQI